MSHTPRSAYTAATADNTISRMNIASQLDRWWSTSHQMTVNSSAQRKRQCASTQGAAPVGGVDQVIDARIDGALQFGASGRGVRRGPISQVHVLFDQPLDSSGL